MSRESRAVTPSLGVALPGAAGKRGTGVSQPRFAHQPLPWCTDFGGQNCRPRLMFRRLEKWQRTGSIRPAPGQAAKPGDGLLPTW